MIPGATCTLEQALDHRCPVAIRSFLKSWNVTREHAEELFVEVLRWMWFTTNARRIDDGAVHFMTSPLMDEMFHAFILATREYHQYCDERLAGYCHHEPEDGGDRDAYRDDPAATMADLRRRVRRLYELVHDHLGPETLRRWYFEYPLMHDADVLERARVSYTDPPGPPIAPVYGGPRLELPREALIETVLELNLEVWEELMRAGAGAAEAPG